MPGRRTSFAETLTPGGYLAGEVASALQKEIRRGHEREALFWATELELKGNGQYVWKRLKIIASEDVGIADSNVAVQVRALHENWKDVKAGSTPGYEGFYRVFLLHAVCILCCALPLASVRRSTRTRSLQFLSARRSWRRSIRADSFPRSKVRILHRPSGPLAWSQIGLLAGVRWGAEGIWVQVAPPGCRLVSGSTRRVPELAEAVRARGGYRVARGNQRRQHMLRRMGLAVTVLLVGIVFLSTAAAAVTPLSGQYVRVGTAKVRVLRGSKAANVSITGTVGGATGVVVSLPSAVKIINGSFSYSGETIWRHAIPPVRALPGTGTIRGIFTTAKSLRLSYNVKRGGASLTKSNLTLAFSTN
jgi:hypothetical protein